MDVDEAQMIGRIFVGSGACVTALCAVYGLYQAVKPKAKE
jgi:hypothetical protein